MSGPWHDLPIGNSFITDSYTISKAAVLEFATEFDPQPYHLDSEAGQASIFGGRCASGWQVSATIMRLVNQALLNQEIRVVEFETVPMMRWKAPVFEDDSVYAEFTIDLSDSPSQSGQPIAVEVSIEGYNQHRKLILVLRIKLMVEQVEGTPNYAN